MPANQYCVLLSIPGLRRGDLTHMPNLAGLAAGGATVALEPSFPCVTCPVQVSMTTGVGPSQHGVVANGYYWRDKGEVEMWTAWNSAIQAPQIWDRLHDHDPSLTSAAWFPLLVKGAGADYVCTPAPIHNPDGSESLWCYTKPTELYSELLEQLGHFPLMNFWGPLWNIKSNDWIVNSAVIVAKRFQPRFTYLYLSHLDYAAQKFGPDSPQATAALGELDAIIGKFRNGVEEAGISDALWLAASEYVITPVNGASFPNRVLREAGYLVLELKDFQEYLVPAKCRAWALVDHQIAHVYVSNPDDVSAVASLFRSDETVADVLVGPDRAKRGIDHPHAGEIVLISKPDKWFAYYWWLDEARAPAFARTVDIHNKPGYDPVEMFIDMPARATPLDASLVKGSHGYPADSDERRGVLLSSDANAIGAHGTSVVKDVDIAGIVLRYFGVNT